MTERVFKQTNFPIQSHDQVHFAKPLPLLDFPGLQQEGDQSIKLWKPVSASAMGVESGEMGWCDQWMTVNHVRAAKATEYEDMLSREDV